MVQFIRSMDDFNSVMEISQTKLVVIDFTASWCGPCRFIGPIFEELAGKMTEVEFRKCDVDEADVVAANARVSAMPTFQFFKGGEKIDEMMGADQTKLTALLEKHK